MSKKAVYEEIPCQYCGMPFKRNINSYLIRNYCSVWCRKQAATYRWRGRREARQRIPGGKFNRFVARLESGFARCPICGVELYDYRRTYCSNACRQKAYRERKKRGAVSSEREPKVHLPKQQSAWFKRKMRDRKRGQNYD